MSGQPRTPIISDALSRYTPSELAQLKELCSVLSELFLTPDPARLRILAEAMGKCPDSPAGIWHSRVRHLVDPHSRLQSLLNLERDWGVTWQDVISGDR